MKRTGRYKLLRISVFFLLYSIITVYSKQLKTQFNNTNLELSGHPDLAPPESGETMNSDALSDKVNECSPPAIEQFPQPFMSQWARKHGGIILNILVAVYAFAALAIVCDDYFVASLDRICEDLKIAPDVAGATFMAAGSSAPELSTVVIGVFFAKDDIGISGVIGSAVFNIMFVIAVSGLATPTAFPLNWRPLIRDCFFYAISILVMLFTIIDDTVSWKESLLMLILYVVYCTAVWFIAKFEKTTNSSKQLEETTEQSVLVKHDVSNENMPSTTNPSTANATTNNYEVSTSNSTFNIDQGDPPQYQDIYKSNNTDEVSSRLIRPDSHCFAQFSWLMLYPIHFVSKYTMPNCRAQEYKKWYPLTFITSMVWIAVFSYVMVWMITIIGTTLGIPDTVMGLTFVAAGVSVPDALASVAVIKEGYGDMAVSNAVGSNVFDILICLGLPWFIQTAILEPGSHVNVRSKGLTYSTVTLFSTVIFLIAAIHVNGWKLNKRLGIVLLIWYFLFITLASLYELNIFGQLNPPECSSTY